jgi:peptidoglycan/LPS O-acetylase OafA/YrhL
MSLTFESYQARRHILALDGLRALAILGVLLHHTRDRPFYFVHGYRGVWLFFVISGYLITTLALREEARTGALDLKAFALRRAFRILPLYYLTLLVYCLWVFVWQMEPALLTDRFGAHLWNFFFYTPEFPIFAYDFAVPFGQTWSLGIEEKFYLVWPFLAFWLLARSRYRFSVTVLLWAMGLVLTYSGGWLAQMWGSYTDILTGCLLAQLLHRRDSYQRIAMLGKPAYAWGCMGLLALAALWNGWAGQMGERIFAMAAALAIAAVVTNTQGPAVYAGHPWLRAIGRWSYAIYLTHALVVHLINPYFPNTKLGNCLSLLGTLSVVLPLCWLLHIAFEQPLINLGRRLATSRTPIRDTAAEEEAVSS